MSRYKVTIGDTTVRAQSLQEVQSVVMEALTNFLAQDPEAASQGTMMANRAFSVGTVQHALETHGSWRTIVTCRDKPIRVVVVRRSWWPFRRGGAKR